MCHFCLIFLVAEKASDFKLNAFLAGSPETFEPHYGKFVCTTYITRQLYPFSQVKLCMVLFSDINAVKNLQHITNAKTLQDTGAGSIGMHCNPAIFAFKNTNI